ncbi:Endonuclease V [Saccharophagus degradans 2-40]|uniref:Endonuclease V n=2 Tax=Saccharophagus degradans TaxID=86304 RepID=Q21ED5_SACD2|nr:Endonuclease V [Saccharophagus degradans 2-40]
MLPKMNHSWELSEGEALAMQDKLTSKVVKDDRYGHIQLVAGVDVAYAKNSDKLIAAIVVLNAKTLEVVEKVTAEAKVQFPYVPGLFSFRELPPLIKAFAKLKNSPDLIVCDGQGYAHPRRFGLACHLGVIFDVPTIGCGKTRLLGEFDGVGLERGNVAPLVDNNEVIGNVLRTQTGVNPIYVSIGHRISLSAATNWVLKLSPKYRLPETTRQADHEVREKLKVEESLF